VGGKLTQAAASLDTYYGKASSDWKLENGKMLLSVEIPANTTATIYVPAASPDGVQESGKPLTSVSNVQVSGTEKGYVAVKVGSGKYQFTAVQPAMANQSTK
jgi:alpha-L-rhamnosidase